MVSQSIPPSTPSGSKAQVTPRVALLVVTTIFFMWGLLTSLNDVLIPHLKAVFELNFERAMLVQFTFFGAYFLMSLPAGWLVAKLGYKQGIVAGLAVAGVGALGLLPAAEMRLYSAFLTALFVLSTGITILQVAANPYVALLGPERSASSRLTLAQALNSLGTSLGPLLGGRLILSNVVKSSEQITALPLAEQLAYRVMEARSVQGPYLGLSVLLFLLALFVFLFRLPALSEAKAPVHGDTVKHSLLSALRHRHVLFGVLGIFFYVGAEVAVGSLMVNYFSMPQIGGFSQEEATSYVSAYWALAMIGRFIGSVLLTKLSPRVLLSVFAAINVGLLSLNLLGSGMLVVYALVAIGLFNSIMFPTIFTLGIERLGPLTGHGSSLLIMAIVGGAVIPYLQGVLADRYGLQQSFVLPLLCYVYIIFYGLWGSRPRGSPGEAKA